MAATPGYPSMTNMYLPNHAATGGLLVGFSRNAEDFPVNRYIEIFPVGKMVGAYASYTSRNAARIISNDDHEHVWADGTAAPPGTNNLESFQYFTYMAQRRCYPFTIGELAVDQADWNILLASSRDMAQQAMTARTLLVYNALSGASWGTNNTKAVVNGILPAGQGWDTGQPGQSLSATYTQPGPNIKLSLQYGCRQIHLQTLGVVKPKDLTLVISPQLAQIMAASTEIQDYIKQSPDALAQLRGDKPSQNGKWGLPDTLYGVDITVEDAVRVSSNKGAATDTLGYIYPDTEAYLIARPAVLEGIAGTRSYSTVQFFYYQDEMTVETMYDQPNKRYTGRIISNYAVVIATVLSGFRFTTTLVNP